MNADYDKLDPLDVAEKDDFTCRFAKALRPDESIVSATFDVSVHSGTDPSPNGIKVGLHQVVGTDVIQRVQCNVPDQDVVYSVRCVATFSSGRVCTVYGHLRIVRLQ